MDFLTNYLTTRTAAILVTRSLLSTLHSLKYGVSGTVLGSGSGASFSPTPLQFSTQRLFGTPSTLTTFPSTNTTPQLRTTTTFSMTYARANH